MLKFDRSLTKLQFYMRVVRYTSVGVVKPRPFLLGWGLSLLLGRQRRIS
jgi:hypothetical protein